MCEFNIRYYALLRRRAASEADFSIFMMMSPCNLFFEMII